MFFFLFNSAIIPFAIVTMIVEVLLVLRYERLLSRWSLQGWSDIQRLGLAAGAVFFFALFFDPVLEFAGKIGSSVVGIEFAVFLLIIRRRVVARPTVILPKTALGPKLPSPTPTI